MRTNINFYLIFVVKKAQKEHKNYKEKNIV